VLAAADLGDLEVAGGDVVAGCVAEDAVEGGGFRGVLDVLANYDGELALVVEVRLGVWVDGDVVVGAG
jgi:hypothetical protein